MSEYQYYEFVAVDRPLTKEERATLRSFSTRARITPTRFVNEYHWGNFKGHPEKWMETYFDAHLYLANWGTRNLYLRMPTSLLDLEAVSGYLAEGGFEAWEAKGKLILSFISENENGGYDDDSDYGEGQDDIGFDEDDEGGADGSGRLAALLSLRTELAEGDVRPLYLGWLLGVFCGCVDEGDPEPPVPSGLGDLTGAQAELARFLKIDSDLIDAAAEKSPRRRSTDGKRGAEDAAGLRAWLAGLPDEQRVAWLARTSEGESAEVGAEIRRGWLEESKARRPISEKINAGAEPDRRTAGELLRRMETLAEERKARAAEKAAREKALRDHEAAVLRERYLNFQALREPELWTEVHEHAASKLPKRYDAAIRLLVDLRDLACRRNDSAAFSARLGAFRESQVRRPSLLARIDKAFNA
ncbi:MAG: hypothetical protein WC661_21400 [Opitutaceae bacterium]